MARRRSLGRSRASRDKWALRWVLGRANRRSNRLPLLVTALLTGVARFCGRVIWRRAPYAGPNRVCGVPGGRRIAARIRKTRGDWYEQAHADVEVNPATAARFAFAHLLESGARQQ